LMIPQCRRRHALGRVAAPQYASALGKTANCQTWLSLTLASGEVPVWWRGGFSFRTAGLAIGGGWSGRCPGEYRHCTDTAEIAWQRYDSRISADSDASVGIGRMPVTAVPPVRQGLTARKLTWDVAFSSTKGYRLVYRSFGRYQSLGGRPRKRHVPIFSMRIEKICWPRSGKLELAQSGERSVEARCADGSVCAPPRLSSANMDKASAASARRRSMAHPASTARPGEEILYCKLAAAMDLRGLAATINARGLRTGS